MTSEINYSINQTRGSYEQYEEHQSINAIMPMAVSNQTIQGIQ